MSRMDDYDRLEAERTMRREGYRAFGYTGVKCTNCGRNRVMNCQNGRHICEKCGWDNDLNIYSDYLSNELCPQHPDAMKTLTSAWKADELLSLLCLDQSEEIRCKPIIEDYVNAQLTALIAERDEAFAHISAVTTTLNDAIAKLRKKPEEGIPLDDWEIILQRRPEKI